MRNSVDGAGEELPTAPDSSEFIQFKWETLGVAGAITEERNSLLHFRCIER
jgi:hypothetical protein